MTTHLARPITIAGVCVAAMLIWLVQGPLTGVDLVVRTGNGLTTVGPLAIVITSLVVGLAGWALLALLERVTSRPRRVWRLIAGAVLLLSIAGPLTAAMTLPAKGALVAMHAVVGILLIVGLPRRSH